MPGFSFTDAGGDCDGVDLVQLGRTHGTPLYVYSAALVEARYRALETALGDYPHRVHYALKANSTLGLVRLVHRMGGAVDANSGGEIEVARRAGVDPREIVFTGVGKTDAELELAVALGVHAINAESAGELTRIRRIAAAQGARARVALRVNPDIDAGSHPGISTGGRSHKFGVPIDAAAALCREVAVQPEVALVGVHAHIGSQITTVEPIRQVATIMARFARALQADGVPLEHLDLGGGLGISYDGGPTLPVERYVRTLIDAVAPTGLTLVLEPGRWIVGPAGVLLSTVVDVKVQTPPRHCVVLDTGMAELMRPALYGAIHRVESLMSRPGPAVTCDLVGPICETTDVVRIGLSMPRPEVGDVLAIRDAGAYGSALASNYNRHALPAEILVEAGRARVIRRRQQIEDLLACELMAAPVAVESRRAE